MNMPRTADSNFAEVMNITYCQMLFSVHDSLSSLNPQATVRARRGKEKGGGSKPHHCLLALVGLYPFQSPLKSTAPP